MEPAMTRFLTAAVLLLTFTAMPAQARITANGTLYNGLWTNGMNMQGLSRNGVSLNGNWSNGLWQNGIWENGWRTNGMRFNGRAVSQDNVLDSSALIEVELPR
jgi:hypothetical protein